jgi:hypothetical protein
MRRCWVARSACRVSKQPGSARRTCMKSWMA